MERLYHNHDKTIKNGLTKKTDFKKNIDENGSVADAPLNFHYKKFYRLAPIMHR